MNCNPHGVPLADQNVYQMWHSHPVALIALHVALLAFLGVVGWLVYGMAFRHFERGVPVTDRLAREDR